VRVLEQPRIVAPCFNVGERVPAQDEEQLGGRVTQLMKLLQGLRGIGRCPSLEFEIGRTPSRSASRSQGHHGESVERRGEGLRAMRRCIGRDNENACQPQGSFCSHAEIHMATMNGVECSAENANSPAFAHSQDGLEPVKAPVEGRLDGTAVSAGGGGDSRAAASGRHMASRSVATPSPVTPEIR